MKECAACKCRSWIGLQMTHLQCPMGFPGHHAILYNPTGLFLETIRILSILKVDPLNNSAPVSNCPCVQGKSNKPPPRPQVCVGGVGKIVIL